MDVTENTENTETEKASLLNQLKIDRSPPESDTTSGRAVWLWAGLGLFGLLLVAVTSYGLMASSGVPIQVAEAQAVTVTQTQSSASTLDASGYIVARRQATVSSKTTGRVEAVLIEEGQRVEENEVIARLDDSNTRIALARAQAAVGEARARLAAARVAYQNAIPIFERNQTLHQQKIISALEYDNSKATYDNARLQVDVAESGVEVAEASLQAAKQNQADMIIRAPFAGVVTVKAAQAGEMVSPVSAGGGFTRTGIGTIVDMNSLELEVDVSENFINRVSAGQPTVVRLNAYPDWDIPAKVIAVIPTADQAKATVKVRIGFSEKDSRILPEMGARVSFLEEADNNESAAAVQAVTVPPEAVKSNGQTGVVFLVDNQRVERRAVRLGAKTSEGQVVLSGLVPGNRVAVGDLSLLQDQARIEIIE